MRKVTYVLIPGLWDQKLLFGWFYAAVGKWWTLQGMPTVVCPMKWVNGEDYEGKKYRLDRCIEKLERRGRRVVLVGVSAGGPLAVVGLAEHRAVVAAVSISGFLKLSAKDRSNPALQEISWFEAALKGEKAAKRLSAERRKHLLTLSGTKDDMIDPRQEHLSGAQQRRVVGFSHLPTVVRILLKYPYVIRKFVLGFRV